MGNDMYIFILFAFYRISVNQFIIGVFLDTYSIDLESFDFYYRKGLSIPTSTFCQNYPTP